MKIMMYLLLLIHVEDRTDNDNYNYVGLIVMIITMKVSISRILGYLFISLEWIF